MPVPIRIKVPFAGSWERDKARERVAVVVALVGLSVRVGRKVSRMDQAKEPVVRSSAGEVNPIVEGAPVVVTGKSAWRKIWGGVGGLVRVKKSGFQVTGCVSLSLLCILDWGC